MPGQERHAIARARLGTPRSLTRDAINHRPVLDIVAY